MIKVEDKIAQRILALTVGLSLVLFTTSLLLSTIDVINSSSTANIESPTCVWLGVDKDYAYYSYVDVIGQVQYSKVAISSHKQLTKQPKSIFSTAISNWY